MQVRKGQSWHHVVYSMYFELYCGKRVQFIVMSAVELVRLQWRTGNSGLMWTIGVSNGVCWKNTKSSHIVLLFNYVITQLFLKEFKCFWEIHYFWLCWGNYWKKKQNIIIKFPSSRDIWDQHCLFWVKILLVSVRCFHLFKTYPNFTQVVVPLISSHSLSP